MKVYVNDFEQMENNDLERDLAYRLRDCNNVEGHALIGYKFADPTTSRHCEIDAVLILDNGLIICIEAKNYKGTWTGGLNGEWRSDDKSISCPNSSPNPLRQVEKCCYTVKNRLEQWFPKKDLFVRAIVLAPDGATLKLDEEEIAVNKSVYQQPSVCTLDQLETVLRTQSKPKKGIKEKLDNLGIEKIVERLLNTRLPDLTELPAKMGGEPIKPEPMKTEPMNPKPIEVKPLVLATSLCIVILAIPLYFLFNTWQKMNACAKDGTFSVLQGNCYKNLAESPLVIGVIGDTSYYERLQKYLQEKLGTSVVIDRADSKINNLGDEIIKNKWDIVFPRSPMNSILASDNGYEWIGRMYASEKFFYESFLVTDKSSPINSIDDIKPNTKVALNNAVSASGFYQPIYDLYGKRFYLIPNVSSGKMVDYLRNGKADVAAVSSLTLKDNPDLKVIHESKELPGSGVLLSPRLSPDDRNKIKDLLFNAPADVKDKANYEKYPEFDYKEFRVIKSKVDNILSCRPIEEGAFQNFGCGSNDGDKPGIVGKLNGWTKKGDEIVFKLKAGKDNYQVILDESLLSKIPGCTTPVLCNGKQVAIVDVPVEDDNGKLTLRVRSGDNVRVKD
ncbi:MAG: hypothetical protein N5P05_004067 (plasmid) [Chroococcopsis gigantea SAG 12.99]|jgi:ABC-type phosphate/phosphonate transport system substrate-binding protein|nr:hypothetical protein [Chroococcopsis gigantea SAG 12.99]